MCAGVRLHYAVEDEPLDTAGAIRFAALEAGVDERFLVVNGDVLTDLDVAALIAFHTRAGRRRRSRCTRSTTLALRRGADRRLTARVKAFIEKPPVEEAPTNRINAGTYVLEPSVLDRIDSGRRVSIERETFPALVADGRLFALDDGDAYWLDTGTPEAYLQAQLDLIDGRIEATGPPTPLPSTAAR